MIKLAIYTVILAAVLFSCDSAHHITKMGEHRAKAIKKGAIFEEDTLYKYITKTDSIRDTLTNELIIREYVVDSIPFNIDRLVYVPMSRQERLALKDSLKFANKNLIQVRKMYGDSLTEARKMHKSDNRTEVKLSKCNWWIRLMGRIWWIPAIIAFAGGFIVRGYWSKITSLFKK